MDASEILKEIATLAPTVEAVQTELVDAIATERATETAVLEAAIAAAKPALLALSGRIVKSSYETSGRNGCSVRSRTEHHAERGLCLVDQYDREGDSSGNRGTYTGTKLWLLADGRLAVTEREGSWSQWQGEGSRWESSITIRPARWVMDGWDLDDCLTALRDALKAQADGKAPEQAKTARARAERLAALVALSK